MNICTVWFDNYPWDVRVEKVCLSCVRAGHKVDIVARNRAGSVFLETLPEGNVHRLRPWTWLGRKLDSALMFPAFFNPRWASLILRTARGEHADVILVRDLPLAPIAIVVAWLLKLPVVLDMAENYPAMMKALWETGVARPRDWFVRNPTTVSLIERWVLRHVDHILVVVEESAARLEKLGVPATKITVVSNTPLVTRALMPKSQLEATSDRPLRLVYLGIIERHRGLETVVQGVIKARQKGFPVHLSIIGDGAGRLELESFSRSLGGADCISFLGWHPNARAIMLVGECDVGLVPHLPLESWQTTIPNKLFDYMAAGLAVLSSDSMPCARIIHEAGCGEVFSQSTDAFVGALASVLPASVRQSMSIGGQEAIREKYNWEQDERRMLDALHSVVVKCA